MSNPEIEQSLELPPGIALPNGTGEGWGYVLSKDEDGNPVVSPDEERVYEESDPDRPGIKLPRPPHRIG